MNWRRWRSFTDKTYFGSKMVEGCRRFIAATVARVAFVLRRFGTFEIPASTGSKIYAMCQVENARRDELIKMRMRLLGEE